ncbi:MAG: transglutaminase family protein [Pseudonocardia sp.]|uniref:transglutaminase family protein n=1 Tax=Pseudonocardia sp. TaxID=60912 RepID=UPI001AC1E630|nr:transglutaminase family protein [Pseudonocardia sp.]MBN9098389.1 transglutaminase family protein [Pseudonocardia sp.]
MTTRVSVEHRTAYHFDRPVGIGAHTVRLRPAPHCRTPITGYSLRVEPANHFVNWQQDAHGNHVARLVFPEPATDLTITVSLVAEMTVINPFDFFVESYAERSGFAYPPELAQDLEPYLRPVGDNPLLTAWLADHPELTAPGQAIVGFLIGLNRQIAGDVAYSVRMEPGVQTPDTTLQRAVGSCRDSAWMLVAAMRELGLAARFVSGYLVQLAPDAVPGVTPPAFDSDFTDLHAWAEVYVPGAGWVGLDATSGLLAGEGHIPLAATPSPGRAAPISGMVDPCETTFEFSNVVRRVHEDPRVTRPYSDEQREKIHAVGHAVDDLLTAGDVRLTMGGEPTFVAKDDMSSPQWTIAADGPEKRERADRLAAKLFDHFAPGGVVHRGQGKWYPGEPLPRWQTALIWRTDGAALWRDASLLDVPSGPPVVTPGSAAAREDVEHVMRAVAEGLGIDAAYARPVFEDPLTRLATEARLPDGDPPATDVEGPLADRDARAEVVDQLDAEHGDPVAWILPVHRTEDGAGWATAEWTTRRGRIVLVDGTSPAGLRLPLSSISWTPPPGTPEASRFRELAPLPAPTALGPEGLPLVDPPPAAVTPVEKAPTTALCVQERAGHLCVFLPPLEESADAVELLGVVERAAAGVGVPVVLEGYAPPGDPRTRTLTVTPDPGVIEVNVHPATSWDELVEITGTLHRCAHEVGLAAETFTLDGTHTGTGGGNHITLGGITPKDSPLLRRPDLLVSMLTFWQHHPSLSYLFSGRFIGPTSQAPRVDEGRHETLYELEIAFAELAKLGECEGAGSWHVDRALRHLLTDITGNTHRSEFCIDKLFSPDSERGRLGLLELRGFEQPPHPDMSLVQALLVRALVARFWAAPYTGKLVRWGTRLHDAFLLPAHLAADIAEVAADLRGHGIGFDTAWLDPFLEFRFPRLGTVEVNGITLELRGAIEPWHVLGEEMASGGVARYVDSSVERVQIRVTGALEDRYAITCNGVPVPLHPAGSGDGLVAGVRFRAWAPPSALHPTIGVHSPLTFDLVDRWNGRSIGGCTYHVVHPGGRSYDTFPVNAKEAEARRGARFTPYGHSPGPVQLPAPIVDSEYPRTLDLRRVAVSMPPPRE